MCNRNVNVDLFYENEMLEVVQQFTYLGITLSSNGNFYKTQKKLAEQSTKAMYALKSLFEVLDRQVCDKN